MRELFIFISVDSPFFTRHLHFTYYTDFSKFNAENAKIRKLHYFDFVNFYQVWHEIFNWKKIRDFEIVVILQYLKNVIIVYGLTFFTFKNSSFNQNIIRLN